MSSAEPLDSDTTRPAHSAPAAVDVDQAFDADGLYALRATLAAHASELGVPEEQIEHLLIIAVELATNAIRHGGGGGRLRFWRSDGHLYCQVSDRGPGIADPAVGRTRPDPTRVDGGRGMWICRNLATEIVIDTGPGGRGATVTAAIVLAAG